MKEFTRRFLTLFVVLIMIFVAWNAVLMNLNVNEKPREKYVDVGPGLHIDLNIKKDEEYDWKGKSLSYEAYFPDNSNKKDVEFLTKNICVKQSPIELKIGNNVVNYPNSVNAKVKGTEISYHDIYDGITMEYNMGLETLKQSYIIHKFPNNLNLYNDLIFSGQLEITKNKAPHEGLSIAVDGKIQNGDFITSSPIEFKNSDQKVIFSIPQSFIEDSPDYVWSSYEGKYLPDFGTINRAICKYRINREDNFVNIDLIVPNSFLLDKDTKYPVYIDPSISPNPVDVTITYQGLYNGTILRIEGEERTYFENVSNPLIQDIFVEVDWMGPESQEWWEFWKCDGHKMSSSAKAYLLGGEIKGTSKRPVWQHNDKLIRKVFEFLFNRKVSTKDYYEVESPFLKHDIVLHIDDGCMGGGEEIPHENLITFDKSDPSHPEYKDFNTDYKYGSYFSSARKDIFHYCIFCHKFWDDYPGYWTNQYGGMGEMSGDDFIVADAYYSSTLDQAKVFMHELGRNLGLPTSNSKDTVMYKTSAEANKLDYLDSEWNIIDLTAFVGSD